MWGVCMCASPGEGDDEGRIRGPTSPLQLGFQRPRTQPMAPHDGPLEPQGQLRQYQAVSGAGRGRRGAHGRRKGGCSWG